jgi:hypothetical protein
MSQSKLPPKVLEAAEAAAYKQMETFRQFRQNDHLHPWVAFRIGVVAGVEWLWSHLSERADDFDEAAALAWVAQTPTREVFVNAFTQKENAMVLACRWQFDQMKAREAALRAEIELRKQTERMIAAELDATLSCQALAEERALRIAQERDAALAEVERLKRELAELQDGKETMSRFLHEKRMSAECERSAKLRAEVERLTPIAYVTSESSYRAMAKRWSDEVERLELQLSIYTEAENNFSKLKHAYRIERERAAKLLQSGQALVNWAEANHEMPGYSQVISEMREAIAEYKGDKA